MQCPVCNLDLVMSERQGIEIDYCPKCRGVWLDRGELDKIIEKSQPRPAEIPSRPQERQYDHPGQGRHGSYEPKKHRKKSFLEELFD